MPADRAVSIPVLGGPEIKLGIRHCNKYSWQPPPLSRCHLYRKAGMQPQQCRDLLSGDQPVHTAAVMEEDSWRVGQELFRSSLPAPGIPSSFTPSVPSSTAMSVQQNWLQPCNPKPRLPYGSHGRIIFVHPLFCGYQSVPLHHPQSFFRCWFQTVIAVPNIW